MVFGIIYILMLIAAAVGIVAVFRAVVQNGGNSGAPRRKLDTAGVVTNGVLAVIYIPLALLTSLAGMAGEAYINQSTPAQDILIPVIEILGVLAPPVMAGSIITSVLLRRKGKSVPSFWIQFAGLGYAALILALIGLLELLG